MTGVPSLALSFGDTVTKVRLRAGPSFEEALRRLALKLRTGIQRSTDSMDVEIDDLLTNLAALGTWPEPATVYWDPELAALARSSVADANTLSMHLKSQGEISANLSVANVDEQLGPDWKAGLTAFQKRDLTKLLSLHHGANFSVPGAGKTRVGLAAFQARRHAGQVERLLVVGPKSCFEAWSEELRTSGLQSLRWAIFSRDVDPAADIMIVNYERLAGSVNDLAPWLRAKPAMLLLDEAHRMKLGARGIYGSACLALGPIARHRLILTGTPAPNGSQDLESLFSFVWPGQGRQRVVQAVAGGDLAHASKVLRPLFTRTTKKELEIDDVTPIIRYVEMPPLHEKIYQAIAGTLVSLSRDPGNDLESLGRIVIYLLMAATSPALLATGTTRFEPLSYRVPPLNPPVGSSLADLMRDLPSYEMSPKYLETLAAVGENASHGRKTLVWSTFVRSLTTLQRVLQKFNPALVYGGIEDRDAEIRRFRSDPDCMVLLSNPATLGEGISLHHDCHDAIYVDRDFAAGRFLQSLDRIHRLGLAPGTHTRVTILCSTGTIDEVVEQRLRSKLDFMGKILDDPAVRELGDLEEEPPVAAGLDKRDIQELVNHLRAYSA